VFRRGSNVLEYWLDHAEGFRVRSRTRALGSVESVVLDPRSGRAEGLVVRPSGHGRRRLIPADAIVEVDPFEQVLAFRAAKKPKRGGTAVPKAASAVRSAAGIGVRALGAAALVAGRGLKLAAAAALAATLWVSPRAWWVMRSAAVKGASAARAAVLWVGPRVRALTAEARDAAGRGLRWLAGETRDGAVWLAPRLQASGRAAGRVIHDIWSPPPR
jgi:hypothetical protein